MSDELLIADEGHLRVLRLNRPHRKNALSGTLFGGLARAFRDAADDPEVWVVALVANGDAFCSGLDLAPPEPAESTPAADPRPTGSTEGSRTEETPAAAVDGASTDQARTEEPPPTRAPLRKPAEPAPAEIMAAIMRVECDKPIVVGVNGPAVGFGVALAMAADVRIASPSATFHPGYARVGTSPDGGATWTVPLAIGYERAMRFFLESRAVPADEALAIGLVSEVTAEGVDVAEHTIDYARRLASVAPIAARQTKQLMGRITAPADLEAHLRAEVDLALRGMASEDGQEAIRALLARDQPTFHNR